MTKPLLVRFANPDGNARLGLLQGDQIKDITDRIGSLTAWLHKSINRIEESIDNLVAYADHAPSVSVESVRWLPPVEAGQDIWASGVTYERSRSARQEEATDGGDVYARVYAAERPELFFKARGSWAVGHLDAVGIRADATWSVPEPELTLVMNPAMEVVGMTIGNDMSSRDIEGANPLYLPQAKVYKLSCALGPAIALGQMVTWNGEKIAITIERGGTEVFNGSITTESIHRRLDELVSYLGRSQEYPDGVLLMTGTGIVPSAEFTLHAQDRISITIDQVGTLTNVVTVV